MMDDTKDYDALDNEDRKFMLDCSEFLALLSVREWGFLIAVMTDRAPTSLLHNCLADAVISYAQAIKECEEMPN